ncbi:hypothetical protein K3722_15725 [Leisingera caerulea]|uniref:Uncharacterized protein n=1 Tax=Leisingera caerulea TaxID=506591 RepID=A0A9Q9HPM5_LEICA|nr:hypothetical protein [Leisingera caerulea]UWQ55917.1 hypothetical protein K3721_15320 [Leisingera caerulea]UWQ60575.1 hypothetical protein K3722_15725 [Leisingera caerulea]
MAALAATAATAAAETVLSRLGNIRFSVLKMSLVHRYCKSFSTVNEIENDLQQQILIQAERRFRTARISKGLTPVNAV